MFRVILQDSLKSHISNSAVRLLYGVARIATEAKILKTKTAKVNMEAADNVAAAPSLLHFLSERRRFQNRRKLADVFPTRLPASGLAQVHANSAQHPARAKPRRSALPPSKSQAPGVPILLLSVPLSVGALSDSWLFSDFQAA